MASNSDELIPVQASVKTVSPAKLSGDEASGAKVSGVTSSISSKPYGSLGDSGSSDVSGSLSGSLSGSQSEPQEEPKPMPDPRALPEEEVENEDAFVRKIDPKDFTWNVNVGDVLVRVGTTDNNGPTRTYKFFSYWRGNSPSTQAQDFQANFLKFYSAFTTRINTDKQDGAFEFWIVKKQIPLLYIPYTALTLVDTPYSIELSRYFLEKLKTLPPTALKDTFFTKLKLVAEGKTMSSDDVLVCYINAVKHLVAIDEVPEDLAAELPHAPCPETDGNIYQDHSLAIAAEAIGYPGMIRIMDEETPSKIDEIAMGLGAVDEYLHKMSYEELTPIFSQPVIEVIKDSNTRHVIPNFSGVSVEKTVSVPPVVSSSIESIPKPSPKVSPKISPKVSPKVSPKPGVGISGSLPVVSGQEVSQDSSSVTQTQAGGYGYKRPSSVRRYRENKQAFLRLKGF